MSFNISSDPVGFWVTGLSCVSAFIASALQKISDQILPFEMFDKTIPTNFLAEQETLFRKLRLHMPSFVPQANHRLGQATMFIGQYPQARRAQQQISAARRFEPEPASAQHAQKMAAGKNQNVPVDGAQAAHHPVGPRAYLIRRLSSRATVAK